MKKFVGKFFESLVSFKDDVFQNPEIQIYESIADALEKYTDLNRNKVVASIVHLCDDDESLKQKFEIDEHIHAILESLLIKINIAFSLYEDKPNLWLSKIEIYVLLPDKQLKMIKIEKDLRWENLPDDVREKIIRENLSEIKGTMYSKSKNR